MKIHTTEEIVRYHETDKMGIAHHSVFLAWLEIGRTGLMRAAGHSYRKIEKDGAMLPVIEYSCRLIGNVGYEDCVTIETWIGELKSRTIKFEYRVLNDGRLIAEGWTKHLCVGEDYKYKRIPEHIADALKEYVKE